MTTQEFESAKPVDYSGYEREIRESFDALKRSMREQGCPQRLLDEADDAYMVAANAVNHIQKDNRNINKLAWHIANLG
jgi:hypothetical protein